MSRILQLLSNAEPGGVLVLADMVGQGLTARGHQVETLTLSQGIARRILTGEYDAILAYQVAAGLAGSALGWLGGIKLRATHLTAIPSAMRRHWRWLDRQFGTLGLHTAIIANSTATARSVATYPAPYRQRLRLIPHGATPLAGTGPSDWRTQLAIPPLAPLLVSSGRLAAQKNHQLAIAALPALPHAHLVIAGDGPLRPVLLAQAAALGVADRLHLPGNLDRAGLASLLVAADLFVFPSTWESFGLAVVEAGMAGLPIVASDLPVLREVLAPIAGTGMAAFHAGDDAAELAACLRVLLDTYPPAARRAMAALALREVHAVERMIDAYCRLIAGDGNS